MYSYSHSRRHFIQSAMLGSAVLFTTRGAFAEALVATPAQTEGPYYPDHLPLDTDNDLIVLNDSLTPAVGEITHLSGRVLDLKGQPIRNATVEIWQCDNRGHYLHTQGRNRRTEEKRDSNFQGYGRFLTPSSGEYYFRTIKPVAYPGRPPHIHVIVRQGDRRLLTTQCYIKGHPLNDENDGVLRSIRDARARESVMVEWTPIPDSRVGAYAAKFDIVIGRTPEDPV